MGLQISDKQEGDFILEIEYIKAVFWLIKHDRLKKNNFKSDYKK